MIITIVQPVSAFFVRPAIHEYHARMIWDGKDITLPVDHETNRWACCLANEQNAETAKRLGTRAPYYHYDALSGRAIKIN